MKPHHDSLFIGGRWVAPVGDERITVLGASTGDVLGSVPNGGEKDIDAAVAAARADERGMRVARRIHTGTVGLNHYQQVKSIYR